MSAILERLAGLLAFEASTALTKKTARRMQDGGNAEGKPKGKTIRRKKAVETPLI